MKIEAIAKFPIKTGRLIFGNCAVISEAVFEAEVHESDLFSNYCVKISLYISTVQ